MCYLLSSILSICGQGGRLGPNHDNVRPPSLSRARNDNHRHFVSRSQSPAPGQGNQSHQRGSNQDADMKALYLILSVVGNFHMGKKKSAPVPWIWV